MNLACTLHSAIRKRTVSQAPNNAEQTEATQADYPQPMVSMRLFRMSFTMFDGCASRSL